MATQAYGITPPGYRLPAETRIGRVRLQVADLSRSLAWYGDVLGLQPLEQSAGFAALGAAGAGAEVLVELHERPGAASVPRHGRLGLYHFAILLPERPALGSFVKHLAESGVRAGAADHLVSEALYLNDPDGLGIEVYADRPRAQWRQARGELQMATEPLDLAGLVRTAAGNEWQGLPAGTRIGHVHLHVADLARAEAFYHDALGLDKVVWSYPGALFLSAGGYHHHLGVNTWAHGASPARETDAKLLDWELLLPSAADVAQACASVAAADYVASESGDEVRTQDPWGTALRIRSAARAG